MTRRKNNLVQPFLKWAGGKRQLLPEIRKRLPKKYTTYYEPFIGGGAVLFSLQPNTVIISDSNQELMNVYQVIKADVDALIKELKKHKNTSEHYYRIRELDRTNEFAGMTATAKAARIIYLNKTCYNGLFRVNSQGQFNVPFGRYENPEFVNEIILRAVSSYFNSNNVTFLNEDFAAVLNGAGRDSFIYLDPPYDPVSDTASFTGYTLDGFDQSEQIRLKKTCDALHQKGSKFLLSNSATDFIKDLYRGYTVEIVQVGRSINSVGSKRGKIEEVLVRNY